MEKTILQLLAAATVFMLTFRIGINYPVRKLGFIWRHRALVVRSLFAVIVVFPLVVGILIYLFKLPMEVAGGLALLAAVPSTPAMTKRSQMASGTTEFAPSLQLTLALLSIVITPLILAIYKRFFVLPADQITVLMIALQIGKITIAPAAAGLLVRYLSPRTARRIRKPLAKISDLTFAILVLYLLVLIFVSADYRGMLLLGWMPVSAVIISVIAGLAAGHILGGPLEENRSVLAVAVIARNVGLALFIAGLSDEGQVLIPTIVTYLILGAFIGVAYAVWFKQRRPAN